VVFNTYGRTPSFKPSNLRGGDLVEENPGARGKAVEEQSMQSVQLVFEEKGAESPDITEDAAGAVGGGDEELERLSVGSGMEVKINLATTIDEEKDTPL